MLTMSDLPMLSLLKCIFDVSSSIQWCNVCKCCTGCNGAKSGVIKQLAMRSMPMMSAFKSILGASNILQWSQVQC